MSLCMNRTGLPNSSSSGPVVSTTGLRQLSSSRAVTDGGSGPTPEEPAIVTCGGFAAASFRSNRALTSAICLAASPCSSASTNIPFSTALNLV